MLFITPNDSAAAAHVSLVVDIIELFELTFVFRPSLFLIQQLSPGLAVLAIIGFGTSNYNRSYIPSNSYHACVVCLPIYLHAAYHVCWRQISLNVHWPAR